MDPKDYTGKEWTDLLRGFSTRQIRNTLKRSYRKVGKEAQQIAVGKLRTSGLSIKGASDYDKGLRLHIYSKGGGFLITVKARSASRKTGKGEKSMHVTRTGNKKPVWMWAEEGTKSRKTKTKTRIAVRARKSHSTGSMPAYGFLKAAEPEMFRAVENSLTKELETATVKVAKKAGFV